MRNSTSLAWDIGLNSQTRYKKHCESVCDYGIISPANTIPPFQIATGKETIIMFYWKIFYACDNTLAVDLSDYIGDYLTNPSTTTKGIFIDYDGTTLPGVSLPCGKYYMSLETGTDTYYSELIDVRDFEDNSLNSASQLPIFSLWRWWDDITKSERYRSQCEATCNYHLIVPNTALPPFQFRRPQVDGGIVAQVDIWKLVSEDGDCEHYLDPNKITVTSFGTHDYFIYDGSEIADLPCGKYYSVVQICYVGLSGCDETGFEFSELIEIIGDEIAPDSPGWLMTDSGILLTDDSGTQLEID